MPMTITSSVPSPVAVLLVQLIWIEDRPVTVDRTNTFYPAEYGYKCQLVKAVPFQPNTALVFLNRIGAHAAGIPSDAPRATKRFAYQFYISPDQAALDALVGTAQESVTHR